MRLSSDIKIITIQQLVMRLLQRYLWHSIIFLTFESFQVEIICQIQVVWIQVAQIQVVQIQVVQIQVVYIQVVHIQLLKINKKSILQMKKDVDEDKIKWIAWDGNK